jgi:hypothetical protein
MQLSKAKPRWYRISLPTLLWIVFALGVLSIAAVILFPNRQLRAVAAIESKDGMVGLQKNPIYLRHLRSAAGYYAKVDVAMVASNESVQYLDAFPKLKVLTLIGPGITDEAILSLKGLPEVVYLDLNNTSITGSNLDEIQSLPKLKILGIQKRIISKELVDALARLNNPPHINLSVGGIDDEDLKRLKNLPFDSLWIESSKVTDEGMAHFEEYSEMHDLSLIRTRITDEGLKHIARLTHLASLNLTGNDITDEGLKVFDDFDQLKTIVLTNTKVTAEGIAEFQNKHPNVRIIP